MKNEWQILGIAPTDKKRIIKKAYAKKLAQYHPEDHPKEFQEIQEAYTSILHAISRHYSSNIPSSAPSEEELLASFTQSTTSTPKTKESFSFDASNPLEEPEEKDTTRESKTTSQIAFDRFQLDDQFAKIDQQSNKKEEKLSSTNDTTFHKEDLDNAYNAFCELLHKHKEKASLKAYMLNQRFFDMCGNNDFYIRVCEKIIHALPQFDSIAISFLYDVFSALDRKHPSHTQTTSVPFMIYQYKSKQVRKINRRNNAIVILGTILILCFLFYGISLLFHPSQTNKSEQSTRTHENKSPIPSTNKAVQKNSKEDDQIQKQRETIQNYVEDSLLQSKHTSYSCTVLPPAIRPNEAIPAFCTTADSSNKVTVYVQLDDQQNPTKITKIESAPPTENK